MVFFPFNVVATACFRYFNNNIISVITPLIVHNDDISLIHIFKLHTWVLFAIFFPSKSKVDSYIKNFIENQLPVKSNQIYGP